jgi:hypothetical protein
MIGWYVIVCDEIAVNLEAIPQGDAKQLQN